jgi:2-polyprenyl-3-methyl-5-hydroxy-6-metoxy-1,4-benzoquinol methylase
VESIAPDGSPIDLYLLLPALGEPERIHELAGAGAEILELGCGVGRITHPLVALGHRVVAVDESADMVAHVRSAETVCARIEELELDRRFPVVLLMSNLVNTHTEQRRDFLRACRRHVSDDGIVLIERLEPDWDPVEATDIRLGTVTTRLRDISKQGRTVSGVVEYETAERTWRHGFASVLLDDEKLAASLHDAGLDLSEVLDEKRRWVVARPVPPI